MRGLAVSMAVLAAGGLAAAADEKITCAKGLYLVIARGTGEPEGGGISSELGTQIAAKIKDTIVEPLDYPATFTDPDYDDSEADGVKEMQETINDYNKACPDSKVAIIGYSQGAQVTTDVICGGSGESLDDDSANKVAPLSAKIVKNNVVAIALFGDPTHVAKASYNKGTSVRNGIFNRNDTSVCETYSDRLVSYCDTGDVYCDKGSNRTVHGQYVNKYGADVVSYIVDKYEKAASGDSSSSSSSSSAAASSTATTAAPTASSSGAPASTTASPSATASPTTKGGDSAASGFAPANSALLGSVLLALGLFQML